MSRRGQGLAGASERVYFLNDLGVHAMWLPAMRLALVKGYASHTARLKLAWFMRLKQTTQTIGLTCFLQLTLWRRFCADRVARRSSRRTGEFNEFRVRAGPPPLRMCLLEFGAHFVTALSRREVNVIDRLVLPAGESGARGGNAGGNGGDNGDQLFSIHT